MLIVDNASTAEQSQIVEGDQLVSVNGTGVRNLSEVLAAFKAAEGREVEIIVRRPRYTLISGRFEHYVRSLDVKDVFEITENGKKTIETLDVFVKVGNLKIGGRAKIDPIRLRQERTYL